MNQNYRSLGETDLQVSPIIFGGNVFGWTLDERRSFKILDQFIDLGFNAIDTSNNYSHWVAGNQGGESETIIGNWLKSRPDRDRLVIMTKVGGRFGYQGHPNTTEKHIKQEVEKSLRRLNTDYIDLYQTHYDDLNTAPEETLRAYGELKKQGKIRYIGVSNIATDRLQESMRIAHTHDLPAYVSLQPEYNLYDRETYEQKYKSLVHNYQLAVIPYYALASGFLSGKYQSEADFVNSARGEGIKKRYWNDRGRRITTAIIETADHYQSKPAAIALAWLLAQQHVTAPIASATSELQLQDFISACHLRLESETLQKLNQASRY
ncbi:MAG: aldo/keto reductase [Sphingobacterium sp.]